MIYLSDASPLALVLYFLKSLSTFFSLGTTPGFQEFGPEGRYYGNPAPLGIG